MLIGDLRQKARLNDVTPPSIDRSIIDNDDDVQLLSRLLRQSKALERLRRALDREDGNTGQDAEQSLNTLAG